MTKTLGQAIERLRQMPEERQDMLARMLLHEIEEDQRWMHSTEVNAGKLRGLINEVLEADNRRNCKL